ncbi:bacterio-opsin activator domain-containing protein [Halobium palmae]|uniref:Bacterio-opsin activator domain-containing protein n=1 Tax=Halobium palmae TaxID=1776492 RepID=A0ABD5RUY2_9EURY
MSVIGEFTVPSDSFLLGESLAEVPEMIVELQRIVAHSSEELVPFFWVQHGDEEQFDETLRSDSTLEDLTLLDEFDRGISYRARWTKNARSIAYAYIEAGATILEATGQNDSWTLRMRFDDERSVSDFHRFCRDEGIPFTLNQLYRPSQPMAGGQYGLTPTQRETLVTAFQRGYYDIPRSISMTDFATELGTTQQTLSKRFRQAHATLIENTLIVSDEESMTPDGVDS